MKTFNPFYDMGLVPLGDDSEFNKEKKLVEESEYLCSIVDAGIKLMNDELSCERNKDNETEQPKSIEIAYNNLSKEEKELGNKYRFFNVQIMHEIDKESDIKKYMITSVYLSDLKQIAVYRDIIAEGSPESDSEREYLETIKDKYRYRMLEVFKEGVKTNNLTLVLMLSQTFKYMLDVRNEFENSRINI